MESPLCRLCGEKGESVTHIVCECKKLAQLREYKQRHDNVAKVVHWKLCEKNHLEKKDKWYEHAPDSVSENEEVKLLWGVNIQCDHVTEARRPDIVVVNKQEKSALLLILPYQPIKELVKRKMRKLRSIRILKEELQECGTLELCRWYQLL